MRYLSTPPFQNIPIGDSNRAAAKWEFGNKKSALGKANFAGETRIVQPQSQYLKDRMREYILFPRCLMPIS